jgi:hypothetical protein
MLPLRTFSFDKGVRTTTVYMFCFDHVVGYQQGYNFTQNKLNGAAFDFNGSIVVLNYAYSYQYHVGHKAFAGLGLGRILQAQYGYAFNAHQHLFRVRADFPFRWIWEKEAAKLEHSLKGVVGQASMGLYVEKGLGNDYGLVVGGTISYSLFSLLGYIFD